MASEKTISQNRPRSAANDILLTVLLAFSIILGVALYVPGARVGVIGTGLNLFLRGLLGPVALLLPALIFVFSILFLVKRYPLPRLDMILHGSMLLIALSALIHVVTVPLDDMRSLSAQWALQASPPRTTASAGDTLALLWESGANPQQSGFMAGRHPGGLLGGMMAMAFMSLVGKFGATIVLLAALVIEAVLLFNFSLSLVFDRTGSLLKDAGSRLREVGYVAAEHVGRGTHTLSKPAPADPKPRRGQATVRTSRTKQVKPTLDHDLGGGSPATQKASRDLPVDLSESKDSLAVGRGSTQRLLTYGTIEAEGDEVQVPDFYGHDPLLDERGRSKSGQAEKPASPLSQVPYDAAEQDWGDALDDYEEQETRKKPQVVSYTKEQPVKRVATPKPISREEQVELPDAFEQDDSEERPYRLPPLELLQPRGTAHGMDHDRAALLGDKLEQTLLSFGVEAKVIHITTGPTITRFELAPGPGVKVSRIVNLTDDIALSLAAVGVRIEAPIPGKSAIGIEISNKETSIVGLRSILEEERGQPHRQKLMVALGRDIPGAPIFSDLAKMPHLLIAGATGSGKSICINVILMNILYRARPDEVKLLLVDPKVVELSIYNGIPHLLAPVVTDPKKAANTLNWAVAEMNRRYGLFAQFRVRDLPSYNQRAKDQGKEVLPLIVLVIDELSDLMVTAAREVEESIARLTAMARAAGIHLIIATQRPSVDVITGVIKANMPSRIAFAVTSQVDSRTILDQGGAEKLLGKGDMLYYPQSASKPIRGQGAFVSEEEVEAVVSFVQAQDAGSYDKEVAEQIVSMTPSGKTESEVEEARAEDEDELLDEAVEIVLDAGYASVSILQRRLSVGYPRAARLIDSMEQAGYIGPFEGSKPRKVLINSLEWESKKAIAAGGDTADQETPEPASPAAEQEASPVPAVTERIATAGSDAVNDNKRSSNRASQDVEEPPFDFA